MLFSYCCPYASVEEFWLQDEAHCRTLKFKTEELKQLLEIQKWQTRPNGVISINFAITAGDTFLLTNRLDSSFFNFWTY